MTLPTGKYNWVRYQLYRLACGLEAGANIDPNSTISLTVVAEFLREIAEFETANVILNRLCLPLVGNLALCDADLPDSDTSSQDEFKC